MTQLSVTEKQKLLAALVRAKELGLPKPSLERTYGFPVLTQYQKNPVGFVEDVLCGEPRSFQKNALEGLITHEKVSLRSPRGCGKSVTAAWATLWALCCFPAVVVATTALAWRQLSEMLWPEIHYWVRGGPAGRNNLEKFGFHFKDGEHLMATRLRLAAKREALAITATDPARIEGIHAPLVLYVFDEAKEIPDGIWTSALAGSLGNPFMALAVSTPGVPAGRFYRTQTGLEGWLALHVSKEIAEAEVPGFAERARELAALFGEDSVAYRQHVLGEFAEDAEGSLIPLAWLEAAVRRWYERRDNPSRQLIRVGVDVGSHGKSNTVLASLYDDWWVGPLDVMTKPDTDATAGRIIEKVRDAPDVPVNVDAAGVGVGAADVAKNLGANINFVHVSSHTRETDKSGELRFNNERSLYYWKLMERLNPNLYPEEELLALPDDQELISELAAVTWTQLASGRKVTGKDDIKKKLGRSPDKADAVMLLMAEPVGLASVKVFAGDNPFYST